MGNFKNVKPLDPNKRYLSCNISSARAFVDFVNPRDDEYIQIAVSFLRSRYLTRQVRANSDLEFNETFVFEFETEQGQSRLDADKLLWLNFPIHITVLRHRRNERPVVIGTKNIDWRTLLCCNTCEINSEI